MYTFQIAFQTAFFSKERPEKRPSLPPCAQSVSATRTLWIRRTHGMPPFSRVVCLPMTRQTTPKYGLFRIFIRT